MRWLDLVIPLAGVAVAAAVPLVRYGVMQRHEQMAVDALRRVQDAQRAFYASAGGYAADAASLTAPCTPPDLLGDDVLRTLADSGYVLELRGADRAGIIGRDCRGREVVSDYYVGARPASAAVLARQAFGGRSDGRLYLLVDGVAPRERDIDSGLAIPVEARESFRIP